MSNRDIRLKVEKMINDLSLYDYRIAKETGVANSAVQRIRNGSANLDNISLITAEKLADYMDKQSK